MFSAQRLLHRWNVNATDQVPKSQMFPSSQIKKKNRWSIKTPLEARQAALSTTPHDGKLFKLVVPNSENESTQ